MTVCEMCGASGPLVSAIVEGTPLNICAKCSPFGKVVRKPVVVSRPVRKAVEVVEVVVEDYAGLIRSAREKAGLTQMDFARLLNEKESVVQKLESGSFRPPIAMAKKLERLLKIRLVEVEREESSSVEKKSSGPLTIGDIIKLKNK